MVDDRAVGLVEASSKMLLSGCQTNGVRNTLAERTCSAKPNLENNRECYSCRTLDGIAVTDLSRVP